MSFAGELRQGARQIAVPVLLVSAIAYFSYHAVQGERGLITWLRLGAEIEATKAALARSRAEERELGRRVALLGEDGLDRDLLDERARLVLGLAAPNDLVIVVDERSSP